MRFKPSKRLRLDAKLEARIKQLRVPSRNGTENFWNPKIVMVLVAGCVFVIVGGMGATLFFLKSPKKEIATIPPPPRFTQPRLTKGIYLPADAADRPIKVSRTIDLIQRTELNAVVTDIKDSTGVVSYESHVPRAQEIGSASSRIADIRALLARLHAADIYVIGRITVFEDPILAQKHPEWAVHSKKTGKVWHDRKGLGWMDPAATQAWAYNADLAQEAAQLGFDEINFDYVRFPSDGVLADMVFPVWGKGSSPKYTTIGQFFTYLDQRLRKQAAPPIPISVDIFGMTFWRGGEDDLNIGQRLEDALPHFDYIQPMLYPSHFPPTFEGFKNPAEHPGEIVSHSLAQKKDLFTNSSAHVRPWLQDFDLGATYTAKLVSAQITAAQDMGSFGWTFWNPNGTYTDEAFGLDPGPTGTMP